MSEGLTYLPICDPCLLGEGDECHTPGCALFLRDVPPDGLIGDFALDLSAKRVAEAEAAQWKSIAEANVKHQQEASARARLLAERLVWIAEALGATGIEVPLTGPEVLDLAQQTYDRAIELRSTP